MSLEYIRKTYRVPAKRGQKIVYSGTRDRERIPAVIVGSAGSHLRVKFERIDGAYNTRTSILHPTWMVEYLENAEVRNRPDNGTPQP